MNMHIMYTLYIVDIFSNIEKINRTHISLVSHESEVRLAEPWKATQI